MVRTISQIAGEFGLQRGAAADPFAQQEKATMDVLSKSIEQLRSQQLESEAARGFGRSTFSEAIQAQQEADILSNVGQQFAQARTEEALREQQFGRDVISQQLGADISSRILQEQTAAQTGLIGTQAEQQRQTLAQELSGQKELSAQAGQQQIAAIQAQSEETRATQLQGIQEQAAQQRQTLQQQQQFSAQQADIERKRADQANIMQLALSGRIPKENAQEAIDSLVGPGAQITTDAEAELQSMASAAGLSVEQFQKVRSTIGTAQATDMLVNPQNYIDDPNKAFRFQMEMAKLGAVSQVSAAGGNVNAVTSMIDDIINEWSSAVSTDPGAKPTQDMFTVGQKYITKDPFSGGTATTTIKNEEGAKSAYENALKEWETKNTAYQDSKKRIDEILGKLSEEAPYLGEQQTQG